MAPILTPRNREIRPLYLSLCRGFRFTLKYTKQLQLVKMSRLVVRTLSAQTCEFTSRVFAAGGRILPIALYQPVWQVFEREGKGAFTFRFSLAPKTPFPLPLKRLQRRIGLH